MKNVEINECKKIAKKALKENGIKTFIKDIVLLECRFHYELLYGINIMIVDYVMIKDIKTDKEYQCFYGSKYYNEKTHSLYLVKECNY